MPRLMEISQQEKMNKEFFFLDFTHFPIFPTIFPLTYSLFFPRFPLVFDLFTAIVFMKFTPQKKEN